MKKKILFVMESLGIGGAEKSLVTLLSQIDYSKYEVDIFLFNKEGAFMELLPEEVNILNVPKDFEYFISSTKKSLKYLINNKKVKLLLLKIIELGILSFNKFILGKEYIGWKYIRNSIKSLDKKYDVAIGFLEKKSIYFITDKVKSKKKIGWIHVDYSKIEHNHKKDLHYFEQIDYIVTVSEHCRYVLRKEFPTCESKIKVIKNMISPKLIKNLSNQKVKFDKEFDRDSFMICTVCRITPQKGIINAVNCCEKLVNRGLKFKWIIVGDGSSRSEIQKVIDQKKLNQVIKMIGARSNPYPYIKACDLYVQPSLYEGFGITVAEAKVLCKAIIVSNIPEFTEQIINGKTGLVYKNIDDMSDKIENLITNDKERIKLERELMKINMDNLNEIEKLQELFEEA